MSAPLIALQAGDDRLSPGWCPPTLQPTAVAERVVDGEPGGRIGDRRDVGDGAHGAESVALQDGLWMYAEQPLVAPSQADSLQPRLFVARFNDVPPTAMT